MSLEDKFNPNDKSMIDRVDSSLITEMKKIGECWQNNTGAEKSHLESSLMFLGSAGMIASAVYFKEYTALFSAAVFGVVGIQGRSITALEEEISLEARGLPKKLLRYMRVVALGNAMFGMAYSSYRLGFNDSLTTQSKNVYYNSILINVSSAMFMAGIYLSKSRLPPPEKKEKKSLEFSENKMY